MPVFLRHPSALLRSALVVSCRPLHSTAVSRKLVGPIDPVSNLRPVIYDNVPASERSKRRAHPYSLTEFTLQSYEAVAGENELQLKLQQEQLDALDQQFWVDSNTRFEAAKEAILSSLPPTATPLDKEQALSEFYRQWVVQESDRTEKYTAETRARVLNVIQLSARVKYEHFKNWITNATRPF
ncbi:hypothetical protein AX16_003640 [Volvariella volvacea WC 439]|nr:hypothetical protein AX16_003640 [Volvariella volvacea WC 439]